MQGYVPLNKSCRRRKIKLISVISFILIAILIVFLIFLIPKQKSEKYFKQKSYYFVYVAKQQKANSFSEMQDLLVSLGGAGVIYNNSDNYYLLVNVYFDEDDANEIKNNIEGTFEQADFIEIKTKEISSKKKNLIKENEYVFDLVKFLYDFLEFYEGFSLSYLSGNLTDSKFCAGLIEKRLELEQIIKNISDNNSSVLDGNAMTCGELLLIHFNNFFNNFFDSSKKESLVCALGVNMVIERIELFDNL